MPCLDPPQSLPKLCRLIVISRESGRLRSIWSTDVPAFLARLKILS